MTILITGGAGFLGYHLAKRLLEANQDIVIFERDVTKCEDKLEGAKFFEGDVSQYDDLDKICSKYQFDSIFHLASLLPPKTEEDPFLAFKVNVEGTINVLKMAVKYKIKTIIYPSSYTVFGPDRTPPFTEDDLLHPWTVYSSFKMCNEIIGSIFSKQFDLNFRAVRFPVVVGPGRLRFSGMTNYPIEMVEDAVHGVPYVANVPPEAQVPIIYVDDAVQVMINLWRSEQALFEIYNIDGLWVTAKELAEGIKRVIPSAEITFKPVTDPLIQQALSGIKEEQEKDKFGFRGKRLLDEILQEYISRTKGE
ncbi:MAG: NAD-dependent epimerase/dehydratase family protein [Candidatus Thorarchaeota archaeon]